MGNYASTNASADDAYNQSAEDRIEQLQQAESDRTGYLLTPQSVEEHSSEEMTVASTPRQTAETEREQPKKRHHRPEDAAYRVLFGENYSRKEARFVVAAGSIIAFNSGMINGITVSGFLTPTSVGESVAGITGKYTESALALADTHWSTYRYNVCLILSFALGSFLAGLISPRATPYRIEPSYGPNFLMATGLLLVAAILAGEKVNPDFVYYLATASTGAVNGIASIYSSNLIRPSMTGSTTDIALYAAQWLRGNPSGKRWKCLVLLMIILCFWTGALISYWMVKKFLTETLFFNVGIMAFIGISLVVFLVKELELSVRAAIFGTWNWKSAVSHLERLKSIQGGNFEADAVANTEDGEKGIFGFFNQNYGTSLSEEDMMRLFDKIDQDGDGLITDDDLMIALLRASEEEGRHGKKIDLKQVKVLILAADENDDGVIDRNEWAHLAHKMALRKLF